MVSVPDFDDLPKVEGMPQGCAWGIFDKDGKKDIWGTLNHLTPEVVKAAYGELRDGISVSLNWNVAGMRVEGMGRKHLVHNTISFADGPWGCHGYDDEVEFNTQGSSQWDSLLHFHHQASASAYNGVKTSAAELKQEAPGGDPEMKIPTLNHWHKRGGLVGRGVFIDWVKYCEDTGKQYGAFTGYNITPEDIEACAKHEGVEFRPGDIFIVRTGFVDALDGLTGPEQGKVMGQGAISGIAGTTEAAKFFWNKRFSAVAGDTISFEALPTITSPAFGGDGKSIGGIGDLVLHQYFLGLFGTSIGELWDLQQLSKTCAKLGRYSFLLTSSPLNVSGLVGSPPNALAIF